MRRILLVLVVCGLVLAAAWGLAGLPGQITAQIGAWTIETTTPIAALALLVAFVVIYIVIRLIAFVLHVPGELGWWLRGRRRASGDRAVTSALVALAAGDKADAGREAARARRMLGDTPQALLLVAEASRLANREDQAEDAFRLLTRRKDAAFLGYRGLLRQAIAREDWAEAAALARQAEAARAGAAWVKQERAHLAIRAGNWAEALELTDVRPVQAALATAAAKVEADPKRALRLARLAWKADPTLAPAVVGYAERLRADGRERRVKPVLRHGWTLAPHPDIAACALAPLTDPLARTRAAQELAAANPERFESRLLLARTALEAGLTGEARRQAEAARAAGLNQRRLWLLLAQIEEEERGDTEAGRLAQRDALRHAATADPDPVWRCASCHVAQPAWHPACPVCATPASMKWGAEVPQVIAAVPAVI
jgi:HemY protein